MQIKQVIVVRTDLNMRKGKIAAQASHASMKVLLDLMETGITYRNADDKWRISREFFTDKNSELDQWLSGSFTKIVVGVGSEQELLGIYEKAKTDGLLCSLIQDAGNTEVAPGTYTACAVGPAYAEKINPITGSLKLL